MASASGLCFVVALVLLSYVFSQAPSTDTSTSRYVIYSNNFDKPSTSVGYFFQDYNFQQVAGVGVGGSTAGATPANQFYTGIFNRIRAGDEAQVSFSLNPNGAVLASPVLMVSILNGTNNLFTQLYLANATQFSNSQSQPYTLVTPSGFRYGIPANSYTKVTVGSKKGNWDAVYVNGNLVFTTSQTAATSGSAHFALSSGLYEIFAVGWIAPNDPSSVARFSGTVLFDNIVFSYGVKKPQIFVDPILGSDTNSGTSASSAVKKLSTAFTLSGPGSTINLLPGVYTEELATVRYSGTEAEPILVRAAAGPNTAFVRGATRLSKISNFADFHANIPASSLGQVTVFELGTYAGSNIEYVYSTNSDNTIKRMFIKSRCPNRDSSRYFTLMEDGLPVTNSIPSQSTLCDTVNLGSIIASTGFLTNVNAEIWVSNNTNSHRYKVTPTAYNSATKCFTVTQSSTFLMDTKSRYILSHMPECLDTDGEFWVDYVNRKVYVYSTDANEFSNGFVEVNIPITATSMISLLAVSHFSMEGINFEVYGNGLLDMRNPYFFKSTNIAFRNCNFRYGYFGVLITQSQVESNAGGNIYHNATVTSGITIEQCKFSELRGYAVYFDQNALLNPAIQNVKLIGNEMWNNGFGGNGAVPHTINLAGPKDLLIANNFIHDNANGGVQLLLSNIAGSVTLIDTPLSLRSNSKLVISNNLFEYNCRLYSDCGGIYITGLLSKESLIYQNIIRYHTGYHPLIAMTPNGYDYFTSLGYGIRLDNSFGFSVYQNVLLNNSYAGVYLSAGSLLSENNIVNNLFAENPLGIVMNETVYRRNVMMGSFINNIFYNSAQNGIFFENYAELGNMKLDGNVFHGSGFKPRVYTFGDYFLYLPLLKTTVSLQDVRNFFNNTVEMNGRNMDPELFNYGTISGQPLYDGYFTAPRTANIYNLFLKKNSALRSISALTLPAMTRNTLQVLQVNDVNRGFVGPFQDENFDQGIFTPTRVAAGSSTSFIPTGDGSDAKPALSCREIYNWYMGKNISLSNGVYTLFYLDPSMQRLKTYKAYCDLLNGGLTLALKVNGFNTSSVFHYNSQLWSNSALVNEASFALDNVEAKFQSFFSIPFHRIRIQSSNNNNAAVTITETGSNLVSKFSSGVSKTVSSAGWNNWNQLTASMNAGSCTTEGFNLQSTGVKARLGVLVSSTSNCNIADRFVGIGGVSVLNSASTLHGSFNSTFYTPSHFYVFVGETHDCSAKRYCSGNGRCIGNNVCICDDGYYGTNCEVFVSSPPTGVTVVETTISSIKIKWNNMAALYSIDGYVISWTSEDGVYSGSKTVGTATLINRIWPLIPGVKYTVSVAAKKGTVQSAATSVDATTNPSVPAAPLGVVGSLAYQSNITLTWLSPSFDGGKSIEYYKINVFNTATGLTNSYNTVNNLREYVLQNLTPETVYNITVNAVNQLGIGPFSLVASVKTLSEQSSFKFQGSAAFLASPDQLILQGSVSFSLSDSVSVNLTTINLNDLENPIDPRSNETFSDLDPDSAASVSIPFVQVVITQNELNPETFTGINFNAWVVSKTDTNTKIGQVVGSTGIVVQSNTLGGTVTICAKKTVTSLQSSQFAVPVFAKQLLGSSVSSVNYVVDESSTNVKLTTSSNQICGTTEKNARVFPAMIANVDINPISPASHTVVPFLLLILVLLLA